MVGWYDPRQLIQTGLRIAATSLFAENADSRLLQPLFDPEPKVHDATELSTIDYISDTGDGFDATYAVAYWATEPALALVDADGRPVKDADGSALPPLHPGQLLVLGGDEVYPTGSEEEYRSRLEGPYELASAELGGAPTILAIPGNHDWYENLVAFHQIFLRKKRFGAWRTTQRRSYFAARLAHDWWILGTDMQLGSDLDPSQLDYFESLDLGEHANVILCHAEPHWVYEGEQARSASKFPRRPTRVERLEKKLGERLRMVVAGDLHHYRRHVMYEDAPERPARHLVTAGGGGAFLHPTHRWRDVDADGERPTKLDGRHVRLLKSYPSPATSLRLTLGALLFPFKNPGFLAASAFVYGLVSISFLLRVRELPHDAGGRLQASLWNAALSPVVLLWLAALVAGFVMFTDTKRWYRLAGGIGHGGAHAAVAVGLPWLAVQFLGPAFTDDLAIQAATFLVTTTIGALLGGGIMGGYLFVSLTVFGRHRNETFSAIREKGYKNFLRMQVGPDGVDVTAFGIEAIPAWDVPLEAEAIVPRKRVRPTRQIRPGDPTHPFVIEQFRVAPLRPR